MKQLKKVAFLASAVCVSSLSTAQEKKWNYGFHLGSDQYFASKPKPNAHNYR